MCDTRTHSHFSLSLSLLTSYCLEILVDDALIMAEEPSGKEPLHQKALQARRKMNSKVNRVDQKCAQRLHAHIRGELLEIEIGRSYHGSYAHRISGEDGSAIAPIIVRRCAPARHHVASSSHIFENINWNTKEAVLVVISVGV